MASSLSAPSIPPLAHFFLLSLFHTAAAALHPDESIALAALKFFLGEDAAEAAAGSDSEDDGGPALDRAPGPVAPSGRDVHRMTSLGTASSKKKKEKKLARVRRAVAKAARKGTAGAGEGFAAIQLLHDPQVSGECAGRFFFLSILPSFLFFFSPSPALGALGVSARGK